MNSSNSRIVVVVVVRINIVELVLNRVNEIFSTVVNQNITNTNNIIIIIKY